MRDRLDRLWLRITDNWKLKLLALFLSVLLWAYYHHHILHLRLWLRSF